VNELKRANLTTEITKAGIIMSRPISFVTDPFSFGYFIGVAHESGIYSKAG
jgi:hypothetical protein